MRWIDFALRQDSNICNAANTKTTKVNEDHEVCEGSERSKLSDYFDP